MARELIIVGGGAAGFFAGISAAETDPGLKITILEKGPRVLAKVRISGGGRCNVTHACFEPRGLTERYPRGAKELIGPFHRFQAKETVDWFQSRGVKLKTEADGRMFPITDSSETVIDCLLNEARRFGIQVLCDTAAAEVSRANEGFNVTTSKGERLRCDLLVLAMGGCRVPAAC
jgi:predicted Rossmann fold flavoprotein